MLEDKSNHDGLKARPVGVAPHFVGVVAATEKADACIDTGLTTCLVPYADVHIVQSVLAD